jgi:hypothetical protein
MNPIIGLIGLIRLIGLIGLIGPIRLIGPIEFGWGGKRAATARSVVAAGYLSWGWHGSFI